LKKNEYSYRRAKQCAFLQLQSPELWKQTAEHRIIENNEITSLSPDKLVEYIKNGFNPETLINSLLSNEVLLKDYGKCMELSGSLWAFLGSALDKVQTTPEKEEE
jgi:hypothetical protein